MKYSFTVLASDGVNADVAQSLTLEINNLDEVAPTITSADSAGAIKENTGADQVVYTATADDSADISDGVNFSLSNDSDAALSINAEGAVTLSDDPDYDTQSSYNFTVVATDMAGNSSEKDVSLNVADIVHGASSTADNQSGALEHSFVQNADGSITLQLIIAASLADSFNGELENIDFEINYTSNDLVSSINIDNVEAPSSPFAFTFNEVADGQILVSQMYFPTPFDISAGLPVMEVNFDLQPGVTSTSFSVTNVSMGAEDTAMDGSSSTVEVAVQSGSDADDVFILNEGMSNIESGAGSDIFVATTAVDSSVLIDFESGVDSIEMSQLLTAAGYSDANPATQVSGSTPDIADLIAGNDGSLDNAFGAYLDDSSSVLTLFVDIETGEAVNVQTYEVTLGEGASFEEEDLSANFSAFIA
jgi:hypothetical protein